MTLIGPWQPQAGVLYCTVCVAEFKQGDQAEEPRPAATQITQPQMVPLGGGQGAIIPNVILVCFEHIQTQSREASTLLQR